MDKNCCISFQVEQLELRILNNRKRHSWLHSHIWFSGFLLYKLSFNEKKKFGSLYSLIALADNECHLTLEGILSAKKVDSIIHKLLLFYAIMSQLYDNQIKFEVTLHFWLIWPTVRHSTHICLFCSWLTCHT